MGIGFAGGAEIKAEAYTRFLKLWRQMWVESSPALVFLSAGGSPAAGGACSVFHGSASCCASTHACNVSSTLSEMETNDLSPFSLSCLLGFLGCRQALPMCGGGAVFCLLK